MISFGYCDLDGIGSDRQLAVASVDQGDQPDPGGSAEVADRVQGRPDRPAGIQDIVDQHNLGAIDLCLGRLESADIRLREALLVSRQAGDALAEAEILADVGVLALRRQRYEEAERSQRQALAVFRELGQFNGEADALIGLGETLVATGRPEQAIVHLTGALRLASAIDNLETQARAIRRLGDVHEVMGDIAGARGYWQESLATYTRLGSAAAAEVRALLDSGLTDPKSQPGAVADAVRQPS